MSTVLSGAARAHGLSDDRAAAAPTCPTPHGFTYCRVSADLSSALNPGIVSHLAAHKDKTVFTWVGRRREHSTLQMTQLTG